MKPLYTVALIALLASPAYGQGAVPAYGEPDKDKSLSEIENAKRAEAAYKRSLSNVPDAAAADPWGGVRSDSAAKSSPKVSAVKRGKAVAPVN